MTLPVSILRVVVSIPALLFLPGFLTQLWLITRQPLSRHRDWLETTFISILLSLCLSGWLSLLLVEFGWFSLPRLLVLVTCYCLLLAMIVRSTARDRAKAAWGSLWGSGDRWTWLLLLLTLIAAVLYFHPHEYILGGTDAGVYVNLGGHITRGGSLLYQDPDLAQLDPAVYPALFREQPSILITRYLQFPGFYLSDDQTGLIIPQFYPLHPVWLAVFSSLGGVRASLYVTPLWGTLGVLVVGLTAATLFGRRIGTLAALLLALTATQIWFARYPTSEALTQLLLFGGIYAFSRFAMEESAEMGVLAGLSLGSVMLVRSDSYFLIAIPALFVAYLRLSRRFRCRHLAFLLPFMVLAAHSLLHGVLQSWPYLYNSYHFQLEQLPLPLFAAGAGVALVGFVILDRWVRGSSERLSQLAVWLQRAGSALAFTVVVAALYAYFVRPGQADPALEISYWYTEGSIPDVEPYNLVRLGWYLSPLGIFLAVLGLWGMLRNDLSEQTAVFLGVGLFFSFLYLQNSRNNPHQIYVMRRYVPAVIPMFIVAAAYAIERLWRRQDRWRWLAVGTAALQVVLLVYGARVVIRQVDHRGLVAQLASWANSLEPRDVIVFNDDNPVSSGATVGTPLRYLYGHTVIDLQEEYLTGEVLVPLIQDWQDRDRRVLLAVGPNGRREPFSDWPLASLPGLWLDTTILESSYDHFPQEVQRATLAVELYELLPASRTPAGDFRVDIGSADLLFLGEGWHGKERLHDGITMRWTSDAAQLAVPYPANHNIDVQLSFRLALLPNSGQDSTKVRLLSCARHEDCNDSDILATWDVGPTFDDYVAAAPAAAQIDGPLKLWIETDTWNPLDSGYSADARDLGVMVDWVDVKVND